jgi:hypothetical protein
LILSCRFRQTKVQELNLSAFGDENIRGFDIPMHDALAVSSIESVGNLNRQFQKVLVLERFTCDGALKVCLPSIP